MEHQRLKEVVQVLEDINVRTRGWGKIRERELVASARSVQEAGLITGLALEKIIPFNHCGGGGEMGGVGRKEEGGGGRVSTSGTNEQETILSPPSLQLRGYFYFLNYFALSKIFVFTK
jgi:hypothetical protein